jgi:hypothetical protein
MAFEIIQLGKLLKDAFQTIRSAEKRRTEESFDQRKDELYLEMLTNKRLHRGNAKKPQPNSPEFELCEALVKDGKLERDPLTGIYRLKDDRAKTWH